MKVFSGIILMLCLLLVTARAQTSADDQYLAIYGVILQADNFVGSDQNTDALTAYKDALTRLQRFHNQLPDWKPDIINYRLSDLSEKISNLQSLAAATNAVNAQISVSVPATNPVDPQVQQLQAQLQSAQNKNAELEAKLKAAFAVQPAAVDAGQWAKAQEQILMLMKDNDLLKASENSIPETTVKTDSKSIRPKSADGQLVALKNQLNILQARVAADEAKSLPYSDDELAMLRSSPVSAPVHKSATELPAGAEALATSAQQHFSKGEFEPAEADYLKILKTNPDNAYTLANLATIQLQENKLAEAEKNIQAALTQSPDDAYNLATAGKIKFAEGKYDSALDDLSRSAAIQPKNPETQNYLGLVYSRKGLRKQAETALRQAIEIAPNYAPAHNNIAVIYLSENPPLPQLALWHYRKALAAGGERNPELEKMLAEKGAPYSTPQ